MNRYENSIPRAVLGVAAVAMTAITIGVSVVIPATMHSDSREPRMLAALKVTAWPSAAVDAGSAGTDLVAAHAAGVSAVPCALSDQNLKPEG